jgi:O-antigen ligase
MEFVATREFATRSRAWPTIDFGAIGIWALVGGLALYLGFDGGGYGVVVHSQVGILVWWIVLVGAAWGLLPAARPTLLGWAGLGLFGGFVAWTGLGTTWSISSERSLADFSLVTGYLGVLVLALLLYRDRYRALRHTLAALGTAIAIVASFSVASRIHPGLFPAATQTAAFLPGSAKRLAWPLNYWNALAALLAFGLPLLLALATSARSLYAQAAAAGAIPLVALCGYLTFSRGGALAGAVAVIVFVALAPERIPKLATALVAAAGSAALVAGASHRAAVEHGLVNSAAHHQGASFIVPILLVCAGVALAQVGIGLAARHATPPRWLVLSPRRARLLLAATVAGLAVAAVAGDAPAKLSRAWQNFKSPPASSLTQVSINRFSNLNSNGRYELWKAAVHSSRDHVLAGSGPGTFQLLWLPQAPRTVGYVENAHSLYFETLVELGVVGLAVLVGFILLVVVSALRLVVRSRYESRVCAAGATAALVAFVVSAGFEWIWQVPVLPTAFLLLAGAVMAPAPAAGERRDARISLGAQRVGTILMALAGLVAIAVPLATSNAVQASQAAVARNDLTVAMRDAQQAAAIEPGAASPQVQLALVDELRGDLSHALAAAKRAAGDEPANWSTWLIISRLQAETGHPARSIAAYIHARSLNPTSPLFAHGRGR